MTTLLQINTSINNGNGQSSQLARQFVAAYRKGHPDVQVRVRDVAAAEPVPHLDAERFSAFISKPEARKQYWQTRRNLSAQVLSARPNAAHLALAELERKNRLLGIVTQNFDGLHHDAGNNAEHIVEMHGTSRAAACTLCGKRSSMKELQQRIDAGEIDPLCPDCGGFLKAATILFGQRVPEAELTRARELTLSCDLFLVVGSSLKVTPAATLPRLALKNDVPLIIINLEPTPLDDYAEIVIREKAGVVLPQIVSGI